MFPVKFEVNRFNGGRDIKANLHKKPNLHKRTSRRRRTWGKIEELQKNNTSTTNGREPLLAVVILIDNYGLI